MRKILKEQTPNKMAAVTLWVAILILDRTRAQIIGDWPHRIVEELSDLTECDGIGFPNATMNECGYCTLGGTGLPLNYSKDCSGSCTAGYVEDCDGICGGNAYIDECSGQCIGGTTGISESDVQSYRDCRGYCTSTRGQFYIDDCEVCHTGTSPFLDCTNRCHLPGYAYMMAKRMCGRCVRSVTGVPVTEILDACGNCKSDFVECPCTGTGIQDACGVCNGGGKSCMKVISFQPRAIPENTNANVVVQGAFKGKTRNLRCLLQNLQNASDITEFAASGNGTQVTCSVKMKAGTYSVGAKLDSDDSSEAKFVDEMELLVYDKAEYTTMKPSDAVFDRDDIQELVVRFSGGRVPNLPLICIISGSGWLADQKLASSEVNILDSCVIPYPKSSMELNIAPSFNGIHPFKKTFTLKFYASPPEVIESYIAEDGHAAVITFDRPVDVNDLKKCYNIMTRETITRIYKGLLCEWATKQQLIITVQNPITTNPFSVTFLKSVLKQDGQMYALYKEERLTVDVYFRTSVGNVQLAISGPSSIPYCGMFRLVGHFSSPKGDADFFWTVSRKDQIPIEDPLAYTLFDCKTSTLMLNASLLDVDTIYTFVLTAKQPENEVYEVNHVVQRRSYIGPLVTAYSDAISQPSVTVDQKIILHAEVTLPDCVDETRVMRMMWSVNNPRVKFDFKSQHMLMYEIKPYELPENSEIVFTAYAFFSNVLNVTSSRVVLNVEQFKLKVNIKGTAKRVVGNVEGNLILESEVSSLGFPVVYQWKCYDQSGSICYNYKENSTEPLLLPRKMQSFPILAIPCDSLKAGQMLTFELQVFSASNRFQYSQVATTDVYVEDRNIPQVSIDSVIADGRHPIKRHPNDGTYSIPAELSVTVQAIVTAGTSLLKLVKWDVKGFTSPYTSSTGNGKTILFLEEGFLVGHGIYLVELRACDRKEACGVANLTIRAVPGIALCRLESGPCIEYKSMNAVVEGCSIPFGRQPVTYQILLHTSESVFPLTAPQTSTLFKIIGPAFQAENEIRMSVQVCDKFALCKIFPGPFIEEGRNENAEEDLKKLLNKAAQAMTINDPITALPLFLSVAYGPDTNLSETDITNMLNAAEKASENPYLNAGQLSLIYSAMLPLVRQENNQVKLKALEIIRMSTTMVYEHKVSVPTSILAQGYSNTAEALVGHSTDSSVTNKVKAVMDNLIQLISSTAPLGRKIQLSSKHAGFPSSLVHRKLLDYNPISIKTMFNNEMIEGSVKFEESVLRRIGNWPCEKSGGSCEGIVVALTLYPNKSPYESKEKTTSPVMEVTLRKPENGHTFLVKDVSFAIQLNLTHNDSTADAESEDLHYKCSYWDHRVKDWAQDGIISTGPHGSVMTCMTSHLTAFAVIKNFPANASFAVIKSYDGLSTGPIVGIIVTVVVGIVIIIIFAFIIFRKNQAANARVSNSALQPEKQGDKLKSMNEDSATVKTLTP